MGALPHLQGLGREEACPQVVTQAVVIGATRGDSPWLADLLTSLDGCRWPVVVHLTRAFELDTIGWAAKHFEEFVFLPESTVVLDQSFLDGCFAQHHGLSVDLGRAQGGRFRMYLGKYLAASVLAQGVPAVADKDAAVNYEGSWCEQYARREVAAGRYVAMGDPLEHSSRFEERHGRRNMVVENALLMRFKGAWDWQSLQHAKARIASGGI